MNAAQTKHLAGTLRAIALTQLVAFGYGSFVQGDWTVLIVSMALMIGLEISCLLILRRVSHEES